MPLLHAVNHRRLKPIAGPHRFLLGVVNAVTDRFRMASAILAFAVLLAGAGIALVPDKASAAETGATLTGAARGVAGEDRISVANNVDSAPAGVISGTVYLDNGDGTRSALGGVSVSYQRVDENPNNVSGSAPTDADGTYSFRALSGRYRISFGGSTDSETLPEFYGGAREAENAQIITVQNDTVISGMDATLELGGRIAITPWFQPAPGRDFVSGDGRGIRAGVLIRRLDEQSGEYKLLNDSRPSDFGFGSPTGLLEPGTYSVRIDTSYRFGNPWDPATPSPAFTGERKGIVVRAGETTQEGKLVLETDFYPPSAPGGPGPLPSAPGAFVSLLPARLLDTRVETGYVSRMAANQTAELQVTGRGGIPATGVAAVVMNVTVTEPSAGGFITVYPAGGAPPFASNLNFTAGQTVPNLVTVKVGASGTLAITNSSAGTTHVLADVAGYYLSGTPTVPGSFVSLDPRRLLDTRVGIGASQSAVGAHQSVQLQLTGNGEVPISGVAAVTINVTVTEPTSSGFVTIFPAGSAQPTASNLNFTAGQSTPNLVTVKVGEGGKATLTNNSGGTIHLIADVAGYSLSGTPVEAGAFVSLSPLRLLDTRAGIGATRAALGANQSIELQVTGKGGIPAAGVAAVLMNVTATQSSASGFISVNPSGLMMVSPAGWVRASTSNLNFNGGQNIPNLVNVQVGESGKVRLTNNSTGTVHLVADVAGYYLSGTPIG